MLANIVDKMERDKASFLRDVEYYKESVLDDEVDACLESLETAEERDTFEEIQEAAEWADRLSGEEDEVATEAEIDRLLAADHDLTFEEMIGIGV